MNLFVYGTLVCPEILFALTGKSFKTDAALLKEFKRHSIFDGHVLRKYPAIKISKNNVVEGLVIYNMDQRSLEILDRYETNEYVRRAVHICVGEKIINAYTYVWKENLNHQLKGDWSLEEFKEKYLQEYMDGLSPGVTAW